MENRHSNSSLYSTDHTPQQQHQEQQRQRQQDVDLLPSLSPSDRIPSSAAQLIYTPSYQMTGNSTNTNPNPNTNTSIASSRHTSTNSTNPFTHSVPQLSTSTSSSINNNGQSNSSATQSTTQKLHQQKSTLLNKITPLPTSSISSSLSNVDEIENVLELVSLISPRIFTPNTNVAASSPSFSSSTSSSSASSSSLNSTVFPTAELLHQEESRIDAFLIRYSKSYNFPSHPFQSLFLGLLHHRLLAVNWEINSTGHHKVRVLRAIRVLTRDSNIQRLFIHHSHALAAVSQLFSKYVSQYFSVESNHSADILVEICSILRHFASVEKYQMKLFEYQCDGPLILLLHARDAHLLHALLLVLLELSTSTGFAKSMLALPCVEPLLLLLHDSNPINPNQQSTAKSPTTRGIHQSNNNSNTVSKTSTSTSTSTLLPSTISSSSSPYYLLAAELMDLLCEDADFRAEVQEFNGNTLFLSLLTKWNEDEKLLCILLKIIANMAMDSTSSREINYHGGIGILLSLLALPTTSPSSPHSPPSVSLSSIPIPNKLPSPNIAIHVCIALTQLALEDENALKIRQHNGVYTLTHLLLLSIVPSVAELVPPQLGVYALRSLRFLFSVERNRKIFKRLFPARLYGRFIDIGHYTHDIVPYQKLYTTLANCSEREQQEMITALESLRSNLTRNNRRTIKGYIVQEVLGKGAFGTVYSVEKEKGEKMYAMKELSLLENVPFATTTVKPLTINANTIATNTTNTGAAAAAVSTRGSGAIAAGAGAGGSLVPVPNSGIDMRATIDAMCAEVEILAKLDHPNIVRYYTSFVEGSYLYIVMELVEGASLMDILSSKAEKHQQMPESDIWQIFIQICLALTYMHLHQRVVHRDLTCSNVMIDQRQRIKIADFGLARQQNISNNNKNESMMMQSAVGTISFSCPEIVKNNPYTEKADIWSLGCILYQMATGKPAFAGNNPVTIATKICEGDYEPLGNHCSVLLKQMVSSLLTTDPDERPNIVQVTNMISPLLMRELDHINVFASRVEGELINERESRRKDNDEFIRSRQFLRKMIQSKGTSNGTYNLNHQQSQNSNDSDEPMSGTSNGSGSSDRELAQISSHQNIVSGVSAPARSSTYGAESPHASTLMQISPDKLRQVSDPTTELLSQLHKIIYITQVSPDYKKDPRRTLINRYKRALFSSPLMVLTLKSELQSLVSMSNALINKEFGLQPDSAILPLQLSSSTPDYASIRSSTPWPHTLSHEDMHLMIEDILKEVGYYQGVGSDGQIVSAWGEEAERDWLVSNEKKIEKDKPSNRTKEEKEKEKEQREGLGQTNRNRQSIDHQHQVETEKAKEKEKEKESRDLVREKEKERSRQSRTEERDKDKREGDLSASVASLVNKNRGSVGNVAPVGLSAPQLPSSSSSAANKAALRVVKQINNSEEEKESNKYINQSSSAVTQPIQPPVLGSDLGSASNSSILLPAQLPSQLLTSSLSPLTLNSPRNRHTQPDIISTNNNNIINNVLGRNVLTSTPSDSSYLSGSSLLLFKPSLPVTSSSQAPRSTNGKQNFNRQLVSGVQNI